MAPQKTPMPAASLRLRHSSRGIRVVSTPVARARRAPTVACTFGVCLKGSQPKNRQAFSQVILWISASAHPASWNSFHANSGDSGHVVLRNSFCNGNDERNLRCNSLSVRGSSHMEKIHQG